MSETPKIKWSYNDCEWMTPMDDITIMEIKDGFVSYKLTKNPSYPDQKGNRYPTYRVQAKAGRWEGHAQWVLDHIQVGRRYHIEQVRDKNGRIFWMAITPIHHNKVQESKVSVFGVGEEEEIHNPMPGVIQF